MLVAVLALGLIGCDDEADDGVDAGLADAGIDAPLGSDARDGGSDANRDGGGDARVNDAAAIDANTSVDAFMPPRDGASGDGNGDGGEDAPVLPSSTTAIITAVAGGQIPLQEATLLALKGSLVDDRAITVTASPALAGTARHGDVNGMIYGIEPASLQFDAPVQLTITATGAVPEGSQAALALLEPGGTWAILPSTWNDKTSQISGLITRGGRYALLLSSTVFACPAATRCGGTLAGAYEYAGECTRVVAAAPPVACGPDNEATVTTTSSRTGSITFSGLTFATNTTTNRRADVRTDTACTAYGQNAGDATCGDLASRLVQSKLYTWNCSGDINNRCFCSGSVQEPQQLTGAFFTSDGKLTLTPLAGANETTQDYCVAGNTVKAGDDNIVVTLRKAP